MNKKDRIAVVVSIPYLIFVLLGIVMAGNPSVAVVWGSPLFIYWGYRFIKGDISFLGSKDKD